MEGRRQNGVRKWKSIVLGLNKNLKIYGEKNKNQIKEKKNHHNINNK